MSPALGGIAAKNSELCFVELPFIYMQFSLTFQRVRTVMFSSRYTRSPFVTLSAVLLVVLTATHTKVEGTKIPEEFISTGKKKQYY